MTLKDLRQVFHSELDIIYGKEEVTSLFFVAIRHVMAITRADFIISGDLKIKKSHQRDLLMVLEDLKNQRPIQYSLGVCEFYGLTFAVNDSVLIPRPETEELVDWIISEVETDTPGIRILDIGTGSGCIAVSLAKSIPQCTVYALDVSKSAIDVAKQNAIHNNVKISFVEANILEASSLLSILKEQGADSFDIIVSNPPYVRLSESHEMKPNVLDNEPHLALFVEDNNPLQFYRAILQFARHNLKKGGQLFFEINENLGPEMVDLMNNHGLTSISLKKDINGKHRMIKGIME